MPQLWFGYKAFIVAVAFGKCCYATIEDKCTRLSFVYSLLCQLFAIPSSRPWSSSRLGTTLTVEYNCGDRREYLGHRLFRWIERVDRQVQSTFDEYILKICPPDIDNEIVTSSHFGLDKFGELLGGDSLRVQTRGWICFIRSRRQSRVFG